VGREQPAEEHDLGDEEDPHAERARLALLLHVIEVMLERRRCVLLCVRQMNVCRTHPLFSPMTAKRVEAKLPVKPKSLSPGGGLCTAGQVRVQAVRGLHWA